jgi:AcrR family transcriptional regulator
MTEILEKASALFARRGFEVVAMDELARISGCTRRTLYRYFPTKDELFWRCFGRAVGLILERQHIMARVCESAKLKARDYLAAMAAAYLDFAVDKPSEFRILMEGRERASAAGALGLPLSDETMDWLLSYQREVQAGVSLIGRMLEEEGACQSGEGASSAGRFLVVLLATVEFHARYREGGIALSAGEAEPLRSFLGALARSFDFATRSAPDGAKELS